MTGNHPFGNYWLLTIFIAFIFVQQALVQVGENKYCVAVLRVL